MDFDIESILGADDEAEVQEVSCPQCGASQEVEPITVLTPDDDELEALFKGHLNQVLCEQCEAAFMLRIPLLFRDDDDRFMVYYLPLDDRTKRAEVEKQMATVTQSIFGDTPPDERPELRLVMTLRRFIEKIAIHMHGLDDRIVEYVKYQLYRHPEQRIDPVRTELLYDFSQDDPDKLAFILFDRERGEAEAGTHLSLSLYDELAESFLQDEEMRSELNDLFPGYMVSVDQLME